MRRLRNIHHWLGVFFAPMILFFAFSGALQTFSLHENKGGGPYKPPAWIVVLAKIHKDQTLPQPGPERHGHAHDRDAANGPPMAQGEHDHDAAAPAAQPDRDADHDHDADAAPKASRPSPLPLKIFVLLLSIGLMTSTVLGIWIALKMRAMRRLTLILLAAGTLVPIVLLFL